MLVAGGIIPRMVTAPVRSLSNCRCGTVAMPQESPGYRALLPRLAWAAAAVAMLFVCPIMTQAKDPWVVYHGQQGPGKGSHIVLVSGDEEYRSEEGLPQLGKVLSAHHGFKCTVLFAIDPDGTINPNNRQNIPGLSSLRTAHLMLIATRFRDLPADQMAEMDAYLRTGRPVIGLRTATHAFSIEGDKPYAHYGNGYSGDKKEWHDGFGRLVLGEKWIRHHGAHGSESTRGLIADDARDHPIVRGIENGDIWGPTDVYGVRLPLPGDSRPVFLGQVLKGMQPEAVPVAGKKNEPMMPMGWTKTYQVPGGSQGRVFTTTMGASTDLVTAGTRRMIVNAVYWCLDMAAQIPPGGTNVDLVGTFQPTPFGTKNDEFWRNRKLRPTDFAH